MKLCNFYVYISAKIGDTLNVSILVACKIFHVVTSPLHQLPPVLVSKLVAILFFRTVITWHKMELKCNISQETIAHTYFCLRLVLVQKLLWPIQEFCREH